MDETSFLKARHSSCQSLKEKFQNPSSAMNVFYEYYVIKLSYSSIVQICGFCFYNLDVVMFVFLCVIFSCFILSVCTTACTFVTCLLKINQSCEKCL